MDADEQIERIKQLAQEREEILGHRVSTDPANPAGDEEAGAAANEHSDTWGFSWMPAIEDFVEQASAGAESQEESGTDTSGDEKEPPGNQGREGGAASGSGRGDGAALLKDPEKSGRKRRRPQTSEASSSSRRTPRPPSYNETLLADKAFHNPHASETMADAFGIIRPASFVLDVGADDRSWGGGAAAAAAAAQAAVATAEVVCAETQRGSSGGDRSWFYDTVRDRQNRLWADTRVRKGVELARKGQHQAAIDIYTQALGMCPDHDDGLVARGAAFATTGRLPQAVQDLSRAVSLNAQNGNASSYLRETRRRMERQEARKSLGVSTASLEMGARGGARLERLGHEGEVDADGGGAGVATVSRGNEREDAPRSALTALLQDGAEGDALRKMRALLEEDERKRRRERKSAGGSGDGGDGGGGEESHKKKARKKEKRSKSKRSSSSRHKKDREKDRDRGRRKSTGGSTGNGDAYGSGSSSGSGSDDSDERSKKKKKRRHKQKKRHRAKSASPPAAGVGLRNGGRLGGAVVGTSSGSLSAAGEDSGEEQAHPILNRKKHSLWG